MRWPWQKREEEAAFESTSIARVAPEAPPTPPELSGGAPAPDQQASTAFPASPATPGSTPTTTAAGQLSPELLGQLRRAGITLDPNAQVTVSQQTTQLSGADALKFLGQLGSFLGGPGKQLPMQVHPSVQIVADGRLQESPEQLRAHGVDARATVKDLEEKHVAFGDTHIVKLKLEIAREGQEPYDVTTGALVPARVTETFAEGKSFAAKVDPNDRNQVLVLWDGA